MTEKRVYKLEDITLEVGRSAFSGLLVSGVWSALVPAPHPSRGERRLVLAMFVEPHKPDEIMVAMEGEGAVFLRDTDNLNRFVFITGGLDMQSAVLVERLFAVIAEARAEVEAYKNEKYPQLTDRSDR